MTTDLAERRKGRALSLFLLAGALIAIAAVTVAIEFRASRPDLASGAVLPGLHDAIATGQRIIITSADANYRIERAQRGDQTLWVMRDRGDYPVQSSRLTELTRGLEQLQYTRRMTSDPAKFDRLGVGDPRHGGRGVLVQIESSTGALLVNLIIGTAPSAGQNVVYVRRPDQDQAWAAQGTLPPLRSAASWLNLRPLDLSVDKLTRVEVTPADGRAYVLERDPTSAAWRIATPALQGVQGSVASAAEEITQVAPLDVQPAPAIQGEAHARVHVVTSDGVGIDAEIVPSDNRMWLKLVARALTPGDAQQEAAALAINDRVSAWAFALSSADAEALAPPLASLTPAPAPHTTAPPAPAH
jgi:hypothetical protein